MLAEQLRETLFSLRSILLVDDDDLQLFESVVNIVVDEKVSGTDDSFQASFKRILFNYDIYELDMETKLGVWLQLRRHNLQRLQDAISTFRNIHRFSTIFAIVNGITTFHYPFSQPLTVSGLILSAVAMIVSLLTFSFSKEVSNGIIRSLSAEENAVINVATTERQGQWIDHEVKCYLFPYDLQMNRIKQILQTVTNDDWRPSISLAIIWDNVRRNDNLIHNRSFLSSVSTFLNSSAGSSWIHRMRLREILKNSRDRITGLLTERRKNSMDDFRVTGLNIIAAFLPFLMVETKFNTVRFYSGMLAAAHAIITYRNSSTNLEAARRMLKTDYEEIQNVVSNEQQ